jgi:isocitrate dehydrogenase
MFINNSEVCNNLIKYNQMKIAVAKGDGIGPEIMQVVLDIFEANKVPLEYEYVDMGKWVFDKGFSNGMTPDAQKAIETHGILFKGPMETPKGKGVKSINVTAARPGTPMLTNECFKPCMEWILFSLKLAFQ